MRISDWSSDVCSSDLLKPSSRILRRPRCTKRTMLSMVSGRMLATALETWRFTVMSVGVIVTPLDVGRQMPPLVRMNMSSADRKSVVSGKRVSVRVDLGGRRIIKKNKRKHHNDD